MTLWKSARVVAGAPGYAAERAKAEVHAMHARQNLCLNARVEWRDEYNDYSVAGVFAVVTR